MKYGLFCFHHEGHILFKELPLIREGKKMLCIDSDAHVYFLNDGFRMILRKLVIHFVRKAEL